MLLTERCPDSAPEECSQDAEVKVEVGLVGGQRLAQVHDHAQALTQRLEKQLQENRAKSSSCTTSTYVIANGYSIIGGQECTRNCASSCGLESRLPTSAGHQLDLRLSVLWFRISISILIMCISIYQTPQPHLAAGGVFARGAPQAWEVLQGSVFRAAVQKLVHAVLAGLQQHQVLLDNEDYGTEILLSVRAPASY